jgi:hypothetical protein
MSTSYEWYQGMENEIQKTAELLYDKAEHATGESMAGASNMLR